MSIRCRLGLHRFDHRNEKVRVDGQIKITTAQCKHCEVRRGWVEKLGA